MDRIDLTSRVIKLERYVEVTNEIKVLEDEKIELIKALFPANTVRTKARIARRTLVHKARPKALASPPQSMVNLISAQMVEHGAMSYKDLLDKTGEEGNKIRGALASMNRHKRAKRLPDNTFELTTLGHRTYQESLNGNGATLA